VGPFSFGDIVKRIVLVLALAASALFGSVATAAGYAIHLNETELRAALLNCALVDEATSLGVPLSKIPQTNAACAAFKYRVLGGPSQR
jgi:hypothetical protein